MPTNDTPPITDGTGSAPVPSLVMDELRNYRDRRRMIAANYSQLKRTGLGTSYTYRHMTNTYRALLTFEATQRHKYRLEPPEVDSPFAELAHVGGWLAPKLG